MEKDLEKRTFDFAVEVVKFLKTIKTSRENDVVKYQLAKAATSVGANYEEAQAAYSKDDFKYKIGICLREIKETSYWVRIIKETHISSDKKLDYLIEESTELSKIFNTIFRKVHKREDI